MENDPKDTRRDYFAAAALQGLLASGIASTELDAREIAQMAFEYADEMIKEAR